MTRWILLVCLVGAPCVAQEFRGSEPRPRVIIETDAGGDPDDEQSLVRFLVYANKFDIEGLIANRPVARDRENKNPIRDGLGIVRAQVNAYGQCYANLVQHDPRFPKPDQLLARTVAGYDDTQDGVNLILRAVDGADPRPVWFCNWGTDHGSATSCLKRALDRVLRERGRDGYAKFKSRLRLSSSDRFGEHTTTLQPPFPLWVDTFRPPLDGKRWYHRFSALTATAGGFDIERDVRTGHGPLGAIFPTNTGLRQKEGDTIAFLYLLPTGMNDPQEPTWGSWAGRYGPNEEHPGKPYFWANQKDAWRGTTSRDNTLARWATDLQNDFRARMDWCVKPRAEANHRPNAVLNGRSGWEVLRLEAKPSSVVELAAHGSSDPDDDAITYEWLVYGETGRMMVTGAIVYDWLYPLLTKEDKQAFVAELVRLAKTQECGYPPTRQGSVTGHSSEAMIMRDMISAGIAIYDEFPETYRLAAGRFFREHLPARNWLYNGHAYHQGDSYGAHRYSWDTYPLWIFDRLGAGNVYNTEQPFVPYLWVYTTRPDGQRLRAGDTFMTSRRRGQPWSEFMGTLLTASYYGDGTLLTQFLRQGGAGDNEAIFESLWRDAQLQAKPLEALPLSHYFGSPFGWMLARTGWDQNAVIAEMKVNEYNFVNHHHLDAGAFQIYYQGALAIDSGSYSGSSGKYGSPRCQNYYWRTIAHNSLLVYDAQEDFGKRGYGNDGGQRLAGGRSEVRTLDALLDPAKGYRTGRVLAHGFGPDPQTPEFTLLSGDLTDAYSKKVQHWARSFVFLNLHDGKVPAALIVFDRVVSADSKFRKYWLLHTQEEPRIDGASAIVDCTQHDQRNRICNCWTGISSQPRLGGPTYMIRNVMYNILRQTFKLKCSSVGNVVYHNTVVKSGDGFQVALDGRQYVFSHTVLRNNLILGGTGGATYRNHPTGDGKVLDVPTADSDYDFDYDGYGSIGTGRFEGVVGQITFSSLEQMRQRTTEKHAVQVDLNDFKHTVPLPDPPFPARPFPASLELKAGSAAVDQGQVLSNVNDGFVGAAPDLGAHELGSPLPQYGPRLADRRKNLEHD